MIDTAPPVQPNPNGSSHHLQAVVGPPPADPFIGEPITALAEPLQRHFGELRRRIGGLRDLVGSGAVAAPLEDTADHVDDAVAALLRFTRNAFDEIHRQRFWVRHWQATAATMQEAADLGQVEGDPVESGMVNAVLDVVIARDAARDLAVRLEAQNARLTATALEVAGTRAYARALEERITSWASRGRPVTDGMVKVAVREAKAAGDAAHAEATAAALAAAAHAEIGS